MIKIPNSVTTEHRFESPGEFVAECDRLGLCPSFDSWSSSGLDEMEVRHRLAHGDHTHVAQAEAAIAEVMENIRFDSLRPQWELSMCGQFPDVPAFLAGHPECMRRRVVVTTEVAPLKLFVSLTSSCGVRNDVLLKRGICLLALTMGLSRIRPVELWTFNAVNVHQKLVDLVKMPSQPFDVGTIAFIMGNMAFTRGFGYSYCNHYHEGFTWNAPERDLEKCRHLVAASPQDVVFPPIHLYDDYNNPTKWVKDRLQEILALSNEQMADITT